MTIEDELRSELSEDHLENLAFLSELIREDMKNLALAVFLPKRSINKREQILHKNYVLHKLYYEEFLKIKSKNWTLPNFDETFNMVKTNYLQFKRKIEEYNKKSNRNIPL